MAKTHGKNHLQSSVRLGGRLSALLNECPKHSVVEVIYVCCDVDAQLSSVPMGTDMTGKHTIGLSPRKVIADRTLVGIQDDPAIKRGRIA